MLTSHPGTAEWSRNGGNRLMAETDKKHPPPARSWPQWQVLSLTFAAIVALWGVLAWPWLAGEVTIPFDAKAYTLPQLQFMAASFARSELPWWSPHVFAGYPQIADPQTLLVSPQYVLLAWFNSKPGAYALDVTLYISVLVGALAFAQWGRDRGWHPLGMIIGAVAFAFGAAMAWRIQHVNQVLSLIYLPIVLLFLDRALERRSIVYGVLAGLAAGLLVASRDQVALLCTYLLVFYVLQRIWRMYRDGEAVAGLIRPLAPAAVTGMLIVTVPVVLTALLTGESNRPEIDYLGAGKASLHPAHLLTAFAPDYLGTSGRLGDYWGPPSGVWPGTDLFLAQNMGQVYFGAVPLLLIAIGAVSGVLWSRDVRFFSAALAATVIFALGWYTPAFRFIHAYAPGINFYRRPADAVFLIGFLSAVLAGYCAHRLAEGTLIRQAKLDFVLGLGVVLAGLAGALGLAVYCGMAGEAALPLIIAFMTVLFAASAVQYASRQAVAKPVVAALVLLVLLTADLRWNNGPNGSTGLPPDVYDVLRPGSPNQTIAFLKTRLAQNASDERRDRVELVGLGFRWPNASVTHQLDHTLGYNPLRLGLYSRAAGAGDTVANPEQRIFTPLMPSYDSKLAAMLGLRLIVSKVPIAEVDKVSRGASLKLIARTKDGYIYENPAALPRVQFFTRAAKADFENMIEMGQWPQVDLTSTVLVEDAKPQSFAGTGRALIVSYSNNEVVIDAESPGGGYVVLNDMWHPWWYADIDGQPAPVKRANVLFRAVQVPPGRHQVRLTFAPFRGAWEQLTGAQRP